MTPTIPQHDSHLLTYEQVCVLTRLSLPTLRRYVAAGKFPAPIKPHPAGKCVRFRAIDVYHWMARIGGGI